MFDSTYGTLAAFMINIYYYYF